MTLEWAASEGTKEMGTHHTWDLFCGWHGVPLKWLAVNIQSMTTKTFLFFKVYSFILRQTKRVWVGEGREQERIPSRLYPASSEPHVGFWTHKTVRSWPELKPRIRCSTDWATQVPQQRHFWASLKDAYLGIEVHEDKATTKTGIADLLHPPWALSEGSGSTFILPSMGLISGCSRSWPLPAEWPQDII